MSEQSGFDLAYGAINCFADDGSLDEVELNYLLGLALKDGEIDDDERNVLANVFARIDPEAVRPHVMERIRAVQEKYDIP